jgi:hypothetical protein
MICPKIAVIFLKFRMAWIIGSIILLPVYFYRVQSGFITKRFQISTYL